MGAGYESVGMENEESSRVVNYTRATGEYTNDVDGVVDFHWSSNPIVSEVKYDVLI